MRRFVTFLRTVVPADPWQMVFLLGVVCLTFCPRLTWRPDKGASQDVLEIFGPELTWGASFYQALVFAIYPIIFAGLAGYFVCFWPGPRPTKRLLLTVLAPALVGLAVIFFMMALSSPIQTSVLQSSSSRAADVFRMMIFFMKYSVGLHFCFMGFFLILIFAFRLGLGTARLPLTLPGTQMDNEDLLWRRTKLLVYVMIGPIFLVGIIVGLPTIILFLVRARMDLPVAWVLLSDLAERALILCVALWIMTATGRHMVLGALRIPGRNFFLLALASASVVAAAVPVSLFLYDRAYWAAFEYRHSPPDLTNYFATPPLSVVGAMIAAVIEEVIIRGFVQPRMVERYGLIRGIFVTGIAWATMHFRSDAYPGYSDIGVVTHLILRIMMCLTLSFVFGWLTLKSKSILPAMLAHSAVNFFASSAVAFPQLPGESAWALNMILWAILAYLLFRYWPPVLEPKTTIALVDGQAEPAT